MANELLALIKARRERIATLETEIEQLRAELKEATELLLAPQDAGQPGRPSLAPEAKTAGGNSMEWAEGVLQDAGMPLHVNDLLSAIERKYHRKVRYATLVGNLSRAVKAGRTFRRFGPNVFGLTQWAHC